MTSRDRPEEVNDQFRRLREENETLRAEIVRLQAATKCPCGEPAIHHECEFCWPDPSVAYDAAAADIQFANQATPIRLPDERIGVAETLCHIADDVRTAGDMGLVRLSDDGVTTQAFTLSDELWMQALRLDPDVAFDHPREPT